MNHLVVLAADRAFERPLRAVLFSRHQRSDQIAGSVHDFCDSIDVVSVRVPVGDNTIAAGIPAHNEAGIRAHTAI